MYLSIKLTKFELKRQGETGLKATLNQMVKSVTSTMRWLTYAFRWTGTKEEIGTSTGTKIQGLMGDILEIITPQDTD
jgi:hypothetical protein